MFGVQIRTKVQKESSEHYFCEDCQMWFKHPHVIEYDEPRGEYWGIPCSEHMVEWHCPVCDGESIYHEENVMIEDEDEDIIENPDDFDPWANYDRWREI